MENKIASLEYRIARLEYLLASEKKFKKPRKWDKKHCLSKSNDSEIIRWASSSIWGGNRG